MPALTRRNLSIVLAITAALCITRGSLAADVAPPASAPTSQPTGQSQLDKKLDQKLPQVKLSHPWHHDDQTSFWGAPSRDGCSA